MDHLVNFFTSKNEHEIEEFRNIMFEYLDRIQEFCVTAGDLLRHHDVYDMCVSECVCVCVCG